MILVDYYKLPELIKLNFKDDILNVSLEYRKRMIVKIRKEALLEITNYFLDELKFRFIIASAMVSDKGYDILYHFSDDRTGYIINLGIELPENKPEIESLANLLNAADWIEREIHELFGIKFINHPNLTKLISEGNWHESEYPYARKKNK